MASLSIAGAATAALDDLSDPQAGSALSDVTEAYAELERAREAVERAKSVLVESIADARDEGARLIDVAAAIGTTRQYVQKLMREYWAGVEQEEAYAARYKPDNARRSLGRTGDYERPRCGGCKAFLKFEGAQCSVCGFMDRGGYLAVPAKTSHLERWR